MEANVPTNEMDWWWLKMIISDEFGGLLLFEHESQLMLQRAKHERAIYLVNL